MPQADFACKVGFFSRSQVEPEESMYTYGRRSLRGPFDGQVTLTPWCGNVQGPSPLQWNPVWSVWHLYETGFNRESCVRLDHVQFFDIFRGNQARSYQAGLCAPLLHLGSEDIAARKN